MLYQQFHLADDLSETVYEVLFKDWRVLSFIQ